MSLEITSLPRILNIPIVKFLIGEAKQKYELVREKKPELKLPPVPEKLQAIPEQIKTIPEKLIVLRDLALERGTPYITAVDTFANDKLDLAEKKFEFFFKAPAPEVLEFIKERRLELTEKAKDTFEEKVKIPAIAIGKDLDLRSKFIVDYVQDHVPVEKTDAEYNYQRALGISKNLSDKGVIYSTEQLKLLREKNALVARAAEKAEQAAAIASSTAATVPGRVQELKEKYANAEKIKEISANVTVQIKERAQTLPPPPRSVPEAKELSLKIVANLKERAQNIPPPPPVLLEFFAKFVPLYKELLEISKEQTPIKEKVPRIGKHAAERFAPEVEIIKTETLNLIALAKAKLA